jgi:hypothetical protein
VPALVALISALRVQHGREPEDVDVVADAAPSKERMDGGFIPSGANITGTVWARPNWRTKPDAIIIRGPMNRGVEIDNLQRYQQVRHSRTGPEMGVAVRMAAIVVGANICRLTVSNKGSWFERKRSISKPMNMAVVQYFHGQSDQGRSATALLWTRRRYTCPDYAGLGVLHILIAISSNFSRSVNLDGVSLYLSEGRWFGRFPKRMSHHTHHG